MSEEKKDPKFKVVIDSANRLSLGISIAVAILLGFLIGYGLQKVFGHKWLLFLGIFWGICAAILNIYRAYKKERKMYDELSKDPKYKNYLPKDKDDDDEDSNY